jgi:hypothetical protein
LAIVLSVLLQFTVSDYPFRIFKPLLEGETTRLPKEKVQKKKKEKKHYTEN